MANGRESAARRPAARCLRRLALLAAIVAAAIPAYSLASAPDFARSPDWIELRTRNFTVITDAGPRVGWDVAHKLERFARAAEAESLLARLAATSEPARRQLERLREERRREGISAAHPGRLG